MARKSATKQVSAAEAGSMSRGLSSNQRTILLAIKNCPDPEKGLSRKDIDQMLKIDGEYTGYRGEIVYARSNRTMLRLQRHGLVYCTKYCKTWGSHEFDTVRRFTLTQKG